MTSRTLLRNIYGWQKGIKTKEMTKNSRTSNDCRLSYMLDFILKPAGKLEYQDNASLFKFKGNPSIDTCRKSRWKFVCEQRIWPCRKSFCQPHASVILRAWAKMTSMFVNRYLRYTARTASSIVSSSQGLARHKHSLKIRGKQKPATHIQKE